MLDDRYISNMISFDSFTIRQLQQCRNDPISIPCSRQKDLMQGKNTNIKTSMIQLVFVVVTFIIMIDSIPTCVAFSSLSLHNQHYRSSHQRYNNNKFTNVHSFSKQQLLPFTGATRTQVYLFPIQEKKKSNNDQLLETKNDNNIVSDNESFSFFDAANTLQKTSSEVFEYHFVSPAQGLLDNATDGWALSYADLSPDNTQTLTGQAFLASNMAYVVAGGLLTVTGDFWFGFCTELAAIASFNYHYQQLLDSGSVSLKSKSSNKVVRLALLIDYLFAMISILTGLVYILTSPTTADLPIYTISVAVIACICLGMSWIWEYGKPYMFWHSLWHLFSAYAGYVIGTEHFRTNIIS